MALTRANAEAVLIKRCGRWLEAAGLDATKNDGTNADLNDPIGYSLRRLGYAVADVTNATDAEVGNVGADEVDQFLDVAELRAMQNVLGNWDAVTTSLGPRSEDLNAFAARLEAAIKRKSDFILSEYGALVESVEAGVIGLGFQQKTDLESLTINPL